MRRTLAVMATAALFLRVIAGSPAIAAEPVQLRTVVALAFSQDGRILAAADMFRQLCLFRPDDGHPLPGFPRALEMPILALRFTPDSKRLGVATANAVHLLDVASGSDIETLPVSTTAAAFSADAGLVAVRADDKIMVFETASGRRVATFATGLGFPQTIAFSPNGRFLAVGAEETIMTIGAPAPQGVRSGDLELFEIPSGHERKFKALTPWFSSIGFAENSSLVAAITFDHREGTAVNDYKNTMVNAWDIESGEPVLQAALPDDTSRYSYLSFIGSSETIVAASASSWGGDIAIIDTRNGKVSHAGLLDMPSIFSAALAPSGKLLATGVMSGVQLREIPSRRLTATLGAPTPTAPR